MSREFGWGVTCTGPQQHLRRPMAMRHASTKSSTAPTLQQTAMMTVSRVLNRLLVVGGAGDGGGGAGVMAAAGAAWLARICTVVTGMPAVRRAVAYAPAHYLPASNTQPHGCTACLNALMHMCMAYMGCMRCVCVFLDMHPVCFDTHRW